MYWWPSLATAPLKYFVILSIVHVNNLESSLHIKILTWSHLQRPLDHLKQLAQFMGIGLWMLLQTLIWPTTDTQRIWPFLCSTARRIWKNNKKTTFPFAFLHPVSPTSSLLLFQPVSRFWQISVMPHFDCSLIRLISNCNLQIYKVLNVQAVVSLPVW